MSDYLKGKRVVDPVLTSIARSYKNIAFISEHILPVVLTDKEGVCVPTFGKTAFVEYDTERAVGTDSNALVREKIGTLDLILGEHNPAAPVDYHEQTESMFNEKSKTIRRATNGVNPHRELIAARLAQGEKVYRTGHVKKLTVSDHQAGGKGGPIGVIEAGMETVRTATGLCPNLMTMGTDMMVLLRLHPAIQAAIGANERKRVAIEIPQDLFQIEGIVIGAPVSLPSMKTAMGKNSVPADIWGDNLMLYCVGKPQLGAGSADENGPPFGYTLRRKGMPVADKYDGTGGKVEYCRYTNICGVAVVGGDTRYLITGIGKQGGVIGTTQQVILITAITTGAALAQQRSVEADNAPCKAGVTTFEVTEMDVITGDSTPMSVPGIIAIEAGAAVSRGVAVQSNAQARAVPQSDDGKSYGIALGEAGGEGDVIRILRGV